jgi:hypothetical protein
LHTFECWFTSCGADWQWWSDQAHARCRIIWSSNEDRAGYNRPGCIRTFFGGHWNRNSPEQQQQQQRRCTKSNA